MVVPSQIETTKEPAKNRVVIIILFLYFSLCIVFPNYGEDNKTNYNKDKTKTTTKKEGKLFKFINNSTTLNDKNHKHDDSTT